ncbi:hypothetical protein [Paenibacillus chitinolyticus]
MKQKMKDESKMQEVRSRKLEARSTKQAIAWVVDAKKGAVSVCS